MNSKTIRTAMLGGLVAGLALLPVPAGAQETDVDDIAWKIEELKRGQQEIRRELAEIKRLLQQAPRGNQPARSQVEGQRFQLGDNPVLGAASAALTLVEFTDYQ